MRRSHLCQHAVQPLERPVQVELDPARCRGHDLPAVLGAPALDEADPDGAHARQAVDSLEALVDRLGQHRGKLEVVEDLQVTFCESGRESAVVFCYLSVQCDNVWDISPATLNVMKIRTQRQKVSSLFGL